MKLGSVTETKPSEYRVGLTPSCVQAYVSHGHSVLVQSGAGRQAGFDDEAYQASGARIVTDAATVFAECEMVVKVKEPIGSEIELLRPGQILYTYLHLAASGPLTRALLQRKVTGIAYETIQTDDGRLPCLKPMSEIAGRLAVQEGAKYLERTFGGRGVLLGGVPGIRPGKVAILGGGVVGLNAAKMAAGLSAQVCILDVNPERMAYLDDVFAGRVTTLFSTPGNIEAALFESDLIIAAVLLPGRKAPLLVQRRHLRQMKRGAVIVDVAVDQGGCLETTRATTHEQPIYEVDGVIHYCVANMPGAVPLSATLALTGTTLRHGLMIADLGVAGACRHSRELARGVNSMDGHCTHQGVAEAFGLEYLAVERLVQGTVTARCN